MLFCYDRETGQSASFSCRLTVAGLITAIQRWLHTMLRGTARKHSWRISVFAQSQANTKVARGQNTNEDLYLKNMMFIHQIQTPIKNTGALYSLLMGQTPPLFGFNLHVETKQSGSSRHMCVNVQLIHIVAASVSTPRLCGSISKEVLRDFWFSGGTRAECFCVELACFSQVVQFLLG